MLSAYMSRTETQLVIKYDAIWLTKLMTARYSAKPPEHMLADKQASSEFNCVFYASSTHAGVLSTHAGVLGRFMFGLMFLPAFIQRSTPQFAMIYRRRLTSSRSLLRW